MVKFGRYKTTIKYFHRSVYPFLKKKSMTISLCLKILRVRAI